MKKISNYLLFLFCFTFVNQIQAAAVEFSSTNFEEVKQQAQAHNRPYFAYFTATWCMPCRMMDETTWQDPNLAKYIDENYYAVKIDVDNFDGYIYKEEFNIAAYPTILLFQPDGTFMKRIEGSITGSKLQTYLEQYDGFEDTPGGNYVNDPNNIENIPPTVVTIEEPQQSPPVFTPQAPNYESSNSLPPAYEPGYQPKPEKIISTGSGLFRFNVEREDSEGFSVQVGVYADYENVLREVSAYQVQFNEPILVHIDKLQDKTVYKVLIGDFKKREKAAKYKEKILETGIPEAFVKDLTTMK